MTYLETVNFLKAVAETVNPTGTFKNAKKSRASLSSKVAEYPYVVLLNIKTTTDFNKGTRTQTCIMLFAYQDKIDSTDAQQETIFENAFSLHDDFFKEVKNKLESFGEYYSKATLGQVLATPEQQVYAGTISGYGCQFSLTSKLTC